MAYTRTARGPRLRTTVNRPGHHDGCVQAHASVLALAAHASQRASCCCAYTVNNVASCTHTRLPRRRPMRMQAAYPQGLHAHARAAICMGVVSLPCALLTVHVGGCRRGSADPSSGAGSQSPPRVAAWLLDRHHRIHRRTWTHPRGAALLHPGTRRRPPFPRPARGRACVDLAVACLAHIRHAGHAQHLLCMQLRRPADEIAQGLNPAAARPSSLSC